MNDSEINEVKDFLENLMGSVILCDTHISWVFLGSHEVWKFKKPVKTAFLDFSTPEKRRFFCEEELRLNKRFAPDIYLRVSALRKKGNQIISGDETGVIIDYAVVSKRLPDAKHMPRLLQNNKVHEADIQSLAKRINEIHQQAPLVQNFNIRSWKDDVHDIENEYSVIAGINPSLTDIITTTLKFSDRYTETRRFLFEERVKKGYFRDCHGDLHSGNIFLTSPPVIFDCIEFDEKFRHIDILYEIAFLLMDLDFYNKSQLGNAFLNHYELYTRDQQELLLYYKMCRALIRAKVNALLFQETKDKVISEKVIQYLLLSEKYMLQVKL